MGGEAAVGTWEGEEGETWKEEEAVGAKGRETFQVGEEKLLGVVEVA